MNNYSNNSNKQFNTSDFKNMKERAASDSDPDSDTDNENEAMAANYTELESNITNILTKMKRKGKDKSPLEFADVEQLEDYYERQVQMRIMHIRTLKLDNEKLVTDHKEETQRLTLRISNVRSKCITRKFQSRFWMGAAIVSQVEAWFPGHMRNIACKWLYPVTVDVIIGDSRVAVGIRVLLSAYVSAKLSAEMRILDRIGKLKTLLS